VARDEVMVQPRKHGNPNLVRCRDFVLSWQTAYRLKVI